MSVAEAGESLVQEEQQPFYVEVPYLSSKEKALYGPVPDILIESEDELDYVDMRKIVGEYKEGGILYYYAKPSSGLIRRVSIELAWLL